MPSAPHVIQRQRLLLRLAPGADGRAVQKTAEAALQSQPLLAALDAALSAAGRPDEWLTLEHLELDLGHLDSTQLEHQFLDRLPALLRREIAEAWVAGSAGAAGAADIAWAAWLHFLRHGTLPTSWPAPASLAAWETALPALLAAATEGQRAALRAALAGATGRQRLVRQFSAPVAVAVICTLEPSARPYHAELAEALAPLLRRLGSYSGTLGEHLVAELLCRASTAPPLPWLDLLGILAPEKRLAQPEILARLALEALAMARESSPPSAGPPADAGPRAAGAAPPDEAEFVANAGVVLLHPFLAVCFRACGWVMADKFVSETARAKAVLLVHFLATGAAQAPEYELRLPKLLCGMAPDASFSHHLNLGRAARAEGVALLAAAIAHWTALKNTSPDGLREAFLQREGKLELAPEGNHHVLTVEQRAQDVLLDRLPYGWGLGLVQLPWMAARLTINWA
ncbi:contractile injection system tape measure protein [Hymenobacter terricola]|uniref:contractile injection system tape measure protein n=1 Tax=Hymenobacter terricola TaxID=2819236 RepID=UPI001B3063E7|nr:contractile injection system tape measure protein [Hymenobacter terricola]